MYFHILTIILVLLKSFEIGVVTAWSWWLVFMPSIVAIGFALLVITFAFTLTILLNKH